MKRIWMFVVTACLSVSLAACGGESDTTAQDGDTGTVTATTTTETGTETTGSPEASAATITISGMSFGDPVTVASGAQVTVKNDDSAEHSVTSQTEGLFDVHVEGNQQGTLTAPTEPGEYPFYCVYHPSMKGTLIVT